MYTSRFSQLTIFCSSSSECSLFACSFSASILRAIHLYLSFLFSSRELIYDSQSSNTFFKS
ncbi:MAG: hypothetical protein Q8M44_05500 [bacterium]|nr:hypothetical protein [bacterium]